jgi:large subunit ribosomal protein L23
MNDTIILRPHITEKTMSMVGRGWYTFSVDPAASKARIASEVKALFKVDVIDVRTRMVKGKSRRVGRRQQPIRMPDWKKAIVHIKEGQTIDAFAIGGGEQKG